MGASISTNSEIYELLLKVQGEAEAKKLKEEIKLAEQAIAKLNAAMAGAPFAQFAAAAKQDAEQLADLQNQLKAVEKQLGKTGAGSIQGGRALLEFSRAAEDAQYGISGVLNNIPGLLSALGAGAGLAGVASLAAVGVAQLYKHWDDLMAIFGQGKVKTEAEEMEELRKKTSLTADEAERLARAEGLKNKTTQLREAKTEAQSKQESAIDKAITGAGGINTVRQGLLTDKNAPLLGGGPEENKYQEEIKKLADLRAAKAASPLSAGTDPASERAQEQAVQDQRKKALDERRANADRMVSGASLTKLFPGGAKAFSDLIRQDPGKFANGDKEKGNQLADEIEASDPVAVLKKKVQASLKSEDYIGKKTASLTPAQKEAATRHEADVNKDLKNAGALNPNYNAEQGKKNQAGLDKAANKDKQEQFAANKSKAGEYLKVNGDQLQNSLKTEIATRQAKGEDPKKIANDLETKLAASFGQKFGTSIGDSIKLAKDQVGDARGDVNKGVLDAMNNDEKEQSNNKKVEISGIREFSDKIQTGIGGDDVQKKQLSTLDKIYQTLAAQGKNNPGAVWQ